MCRNSTILVADNNADDAYFLARAFNKAGSSATLRFVQDGHEAISYLQGHGPYGNRGRFPFPNLLVLELCLPGMSGLELLEWLGRHCFFRRLVVGILSDIEYKPDIQRALALGAKFHFTKRPYAKELVEIARQLTEKCAAGPSTSEISANARYKQVCPVCR